MRAEKIMIKIPLPNNRFEDIEELIASSKDRRNKNNKVEEELQRPSSPIRTVKRTTNLHLNYDSTNESLENQGLLGTTHEMEELIEKRDDLIQLVEQMRKFKQEEKDKTQERFNLIQSIMKNTPSTKSSNCKRISKSKSKSRK